MKKLKIVKFVQKEDVFFSMLGIAFFSVSAYNKAMRGSDKKITIPACAGYSSFD